MHVVVCFLLLVILSLKPTSGIDYLDKQKTFCVRGIMMVAICFSHILPNDNGNNLLRFFFPATVAPFFFYSGYGLSLKTELLFDESDNKSKYLNGFFTKRLSRIVLTAVLVNLIYIVSTELNSGYEDLKDIFRDFCNIRWFTAAIIIFYIAFYFCYRKRLNEDYKYNAVAYALFLLVYVLICRRIGLSSTWYGNCLAFLLGLLWAHYLKEINAVIYDHYLELVFGVTVFLIGCNCLIILRERNIISFAGIGLFAAFSIGVLYPVFLNLLLVKFDFRIPKIWNWLGTISLEIYLAERLSHPLVSIMLNKIGVYSREIYAIFALTIGGLLASLIYYITSFALKKRLR